MYGKSMAHVERIVNVYPIDGADRVEMAQVLDYHVVVKKGEFSIGDMALYIEIDSIVPDGLPDEYQPRMNELKKLIYSPDKVVKDQAMQEINALEKFNTIPYFAFLRSRNFKVKQVHFGKLGIYSQGILFKLDVFNNPDIKSIVGFDATAILNIKQIVEDVDEAGINDDNDALGNFLTKNVIGKKINKTLMRYSWFRKFLHSCKTPSTWLSIFPPKSDEDNAQKVFSKMKLLYGDKKWYVSEKLEGQNISIASIRKSLLGYFSRTDILVCSRTGVKHKANNCGFWKTVKNHNYDKILKNIPGNWFVRGEHCGVMKGAIQGNIYGFTGSDIYVFDVYRLDNNTKIMLTIDEMLDFCDTHGFKHVPIIDKNFVLPETVQELLDYSNGLSVFGNNVMREGIVLRLVDDPRISFKVRSPKYLDKRK